MNLPKSYRNRLEESFSDVEKKIDLFLEQLGALENLCQSGSISHTQGLKNGISDRHRGNITTNKRG